MGQRSPIHVLLRPVRPVIVARHLGRISVVLWVLMAVPTLFAYASGDWPLGHRLLLGALAPCLLLAACALVPARRRADPGQ